MKKNKGPFRPVDSFGRAMVPKGDIYESIDGKEIIKINQNVSICNDVDIKNKNIEKIESLSINDNGDSFVFTPIASGNIDVDTSISKYSYDDMFYPDGSIKNNKDAYIYLKNKVLDNENLSDDEIRFFNDYSMSISLYNLGPDTFNNDISMYSEQEDIFDIDYHFVEDENPDWYDDYLDRSEARRREADDLALIMAALEDEAGF